MTQTVSAVIPVRDRRQFIVQAVKSACSQTNPPLEVVVVDDGSVDGSGDLVQGISPLVRVIKQHSQGRSSARNRGIQESTGSLVAFLDSDDVWLPDKLARQVAEFAKDPLLGMVAGHVLVVDDAGQEVPSVTATCRRELDRYVAGGCTASAGVRHPGLYTSSVIVRREALHDVGLFDVDISGTEDWDLWLRIARRWRVKAVPWPPLTLYRVHGGNTSNEKMAIATIAVARRHVSLAPPLPRDAQAHLLVKQARGHRILGQEPEARRIALRAVARHPSAALAAGAPRLLTGSLLSRPTGWMRSKLLHLLMENRTRS